MGLKTIRDVDDGTWRKLKILATRNSVNIGVMLERVVLEYSKRADEVWNKILNWKPVISAKEANRRKALVKESRKEVGFR